MYRIAVLLAEDHTIVRKGLRALLENEPDIVVVAEAADGREAVQLVQQRRPDIVLMDITMPGLNGLEATRQIAAHFPDVRVLVLTRHADESYVLAILQAGAAGYIIKRAAPAELTAAIRTVYQGQRFLSADLTDPLEAKDAGHSGAPQNAFETLTPREREVLQLVAEGHPNRDIADLLNISVKTVENHKASLSDKLGVRTTAELTQIAIRRGVISLDP